MEKAALKAGEAGKGGSGGGDAAAAAAAGSGSGAAGFGDGLAEGFAGGDGVLSMESLSRLSQALDDQASILNSAAVTIQARVRGFLARLGWKEDRQRAVLIQATVRGHQARAHGTASNAAGDASTSLSLDERMGGQRGGASPTPRKSDAGLPSGRRRSTAR